MSADSVHHDGVTQTLCVKTQELALQAPDALQLYRTIYWLSLHYNGAPMSTGGARASKNALNSADSAGVTAPFESTSSMLWKPRSRRASQPLSRKWPAGFALPRLQRCRRTIAAYRCCSCALQHTFFLLQLHAS